MSAEGANQPRGADTRIQRVTCLCAFLGLTPQAILISRLRRSKHLDAAVCLVESLFQTDLARTTINRNSSVITADEIRTAHLTIVDNHGKVLTETVGIDGEIHVKRYAGEEETTY